MEWEFVLPIIIGGTPPIVWLWFWMHEDKDPEPRLAIITIFVLGGLSVYPTIFLESLAAKILITSWIIIIGYAAIEEIIKMAVGSLPILKKHLVDEIVDYPIYIITAAMGFAFVENILFLFGQSFLGDTELLVWTGNMRFLGATILHGVTACAIGIGLAYRHYTPVFWKKIAFTVCGLLFAIVLHAAFNFFILQGTSSYVFILIFGALWVATLIILFFMEKVRNLHKKNTL